MGTNSSMPGALRGAVRIIATPSTSIVIRISVNRGCTAVMAIMSAEAIVLARDRLLTKVSLCVHIIHLFTCAIPVMGMASLSQNRAGQI